MSKGKRIMPTLTVCHYLYLTREQRYALHEGQELEVTGITVPVWFHKGNTSEPAQEIFCKYKLTNDRQGTRVVNNAEGYEINMPSVEVKNEYVDSELIKSVQNKLGTTERLLDQEDGGLEWCEFKFFQKMQIENKQYYNIHFVEIKPLQILTDTLG
jgi:hypothetical protein